MQPLKKNATLPSMTSNNHHSSKSIPFWFACLAHFLFTLVITPLTHAAPLTVEQLPSDPDYQLARTAVGDHLPGLSLRHFETLLKKDLAKKTRQKIQLEYAQALTRAGQAQKALNLYKKITLKNPDPYWQARAHTALNQTTQALNLLKPLAEKEPQLLLALSTLEAGRGELANAHRLLNPLLTNNDPTLTAEAHLRQTLLSLQLGENVQLPEKLTPLTPQQKQLTTYLQALILLRDQKKPEALEAIKSLLNPDEPLSPQLRQASELTHAQILALDEDKTPAANYLIATWNPDTPIGTLQNHTNLILQWLPEIPTGDFDQTLNTYATDATPSSRSAYSLYLQALRSAATASPQGTIDALALLEKLRKNHASLAPALSHQSHIDSGLLAYQANDLDTAYQHLTSLSAPIHPKSQISPTLRIQSLRLAARIAHLKKQPTDTTRLLQQATALAQKISQEKLNNLASSDQALHLLNDPQRAENFASTVEKITAPKLRQNLLLEQGLTLHSQNQTRARNSLEKFLINNPEHPRHQEASLALAENCLNLDPTDPILAQSHLNRLKTFENPLLQTRLLIAQLQLDDHTQKNNASAKTLAFLKANPTHPQAPLLRLKHAQYLEKNKQTEQAHLAYEKLIQDHPEHALTPIARLHSARTSIAIGTTQSIEKALTRYDELIENTPPLATLSRLEKARALLDHDRPAEALTTTEHLLTQKKLPSHSQQQALLLSAEANTLSGNHAQSLQSYEKLLTFKNLPPTTKNRISFLRARILEKLDRPADALDAYYRVLTREDTPPEQKILEWYWYNKCAFDGALPLLEKSQSWRAAHALAQRLAESGGPQSNRAKKYAQQLSLKHMIWEK